MKKTGGGSLALLLPILVFTVLCSVQPAKTLIILHANDTHSAMLPISRPPDPTPFSGPSADHRIGRPAGRLSPEGSDRGYAGIARMAALIKRLRTTRRNVLALHAGDAFVGSFEFNEYLGLPELKIMENLYDAMELGNHEFDLGLEALTGIVTSAFPNGDPAMSLLNANFDLSNLGALSGVVHKNIVKTMDGVKIGIFGLLTEDAENYSEAVIARFSGDIHGVAAAQVKALREKGCRVVICLSHLGASGDSSLADGVEGIDIIVGGHSHDLFGKAIVRHGTIIVQAGSHGRYLGELSVSVGPRGVKLLKWQVHDVDRTVSPDPAVQARLDVLQAGILEDPRYSMFGNVYADTVATAVRTIDPDPPSFGPCRDAPLADLVTDAMKSAVEHAGYAVDCALDALGYTSFGFPAGKIVGSDIMRAVPYGYDRESGLGFKLVVASMPGPLILGGLDHAVSSGSASMSIQVSGMTYAYHSGAGHVIPESVLINGEQVALDPDKRYHVVMTDGVYRFLAAFAESQGSPLSAPLETGIPEYKAVHDYLRSLGVVDYNPEGRVKDLAPAAAATKRR
jgi:5'-nucleotidase/UDP-sugar diphosphatase